jgi:hypothetical protein
VRLVVNEFMSLDGVVETPSLDGPVGALGFSRRSRELPSRLGVRQDHATPGRDEPSETAVSGPVPYAAGTPVGPKTRAPPTGDQGLAVTGAVTLASWVV